MDEIANEASMTEVYKMRGIEIESNCSLSPPKQEQGDIKWNTEEGSSKQNKGKWLFIQCIIKPWNSLPQDVVDVVNLHGFKKDWKRSWKKKSSRAIKYKDITSGSGRHWNANPKMLGECSEEVSLCCFTFPQAYIYCWPLSGRGRCVRWLLEQLKQVFLCHCFVQLSYGVNQVVATSRNTIHFLTILLWLRAVIRKWVYC